MTNTIWQTETKWFWNMHPFMKRIHDASLQNHTPAACKDDQITFLATVRMWQYVKSKKNPVTSKLCFWQVLVRYFSFHSVQRQRETIFEKLTLPEKFIVAQFFFKLSDSLPLGLYVGMCFISQSLIDALKNQLFTVICYGYLCSRSAHFMKDRNI